MIYSLCILPSSKYLSCMKYLNNDIMMRVYKIIDLLLYNIEKYEL